MQYAVIGVREHEDGGGDGGGGEGNDGESSGLDGGTVTKVFSSDGPGLCWPSALSSFSAIGERPFVEIRPGRAAVEVIELCVG